MQSIKTSIPIVTRYFRNTNRLYKRPSFECLSASFRGIFFSTISEVSHRSSPIMSQQGESTVKSLDLGKVYIQNNSSKDMMTISFEYTFSNGKVKKFNLYRKGTENLSTSLERIKLNLFKLNRRNNKRIQNENHDENETICRLSLNGVNIDPDTTKNIEAWTEGVVLELNGKLYEVRTNEPQVSNLRLPPIIMQGYTIMPVVDVVNCNITDCKFVWYRRLNVKELDTIIQQGGDPSSIETDSLNRYYYRLAEGMAYTPTQDDLAHYLRIVCHPSDGVRYGPIAEFYCQNLVEVGPIGCPFEKRHSYTREVLSEPNEFRCVTYNILADLYADSDYSRTVLFSHCPAFALDIDYRRPLIIKEINGYNADLICLQEVDRKEYFGAYEPFFIVNGDYSGVFDTKGGQVGEGVATFFRSSKFEMINTHCTIVSDLIRHTSKRPDPSENVSDTGDSKPEGTTCEPNNNLRPHLILDGEISEAEKCLSIFDAIRSAISANQNLSKRFMDRHTVLQTTLLKFKNSTNKFIIVANTHLYFAPDADHVRLLQGSVCIKYLEYLKNYFYQKMTSSQIVCKPDISIVLCGDMNSSPDCGLYKLVTEGRVSDNLPDWSSNEEEKVIGLSLETSLRFLPAYENLGYTNYTPGFNGCLDYIYYERDKLVCKNTVPVPDHEDVTVTGGIPSTLFPSDHLALIADMKYVE